MAKKYEIVDQNLPFFAYGLFKPDELAYHQIENYVEKEFPFEVCGYLFDKDGMAALQTIDSSIMNVGSKVKGFLITFKKEFANEAYKTINNFEPRIYTWKRKAIEETTFNCLCVSDEIMLMIHQLGKDEWSSSDDTMFNDGMRYLFNRIHEFDQSSQTDLLNMFELQMYYLFLYSILNRYSDFKLGPDTIGCIPDECFQDLFDFRKEKNIKLRSLGHCVMCTTKTQPVTLKDSSSLKDFGDFFRYIRNNAVHHGKGVFRDIDLLKDALIDLYFMLYFFFKEKLSIDYSKETPNHSGVINEAELIRLYKRF